MRSLLLARRSAFFLSEGEALPLRVALVAIPPGLTVSRSGRVDNRAWTGHA